VWFEDLVRRSPAGSDKTRRILGELETRGYIRRARVRGADGRFTWESEVFETPQPVVVGQSNDAPYAENRHMVDGAPYAGFPHMAEPHAVKPYAAEPHMENRQIYQELRNNTDSPRTNKESDSFTQGAVYVEQTPTPELPAETDFDRLFKANLIQVVQERWPSLRGGFTFAPATLLLLRQIEAGGPLLTAKALDWALDRWEDAKPNEQFDPSNVGAVNWLLTTARGYRHGATPRGNARPTRPQSARQPATPRYRPTGIQELKFD
jgi:hypothetical protein